MKNRLFFFFGILFTVFVLLSWGTVISAESNSQETPSKTADVVLGSSGINFLPKVDYNKLIINVAAPDGNMITKSFKAGTTPYFALADFKDIQCVDGSYTYELRFVPYLENRVRNDAGKTERFAVPETKTQTGYFRVENGAIVTSGASEGISTVQDIVHADDVIIDGSLCVGNDCYSGLAFGFDTIVLMENNLRIFFDDTSTIQNYPRNDWRIICNDSTDAGGNYFAIEDATEVSNILVLEAGAPDNSLYVDSHGDVGINTSTPYYELHIVDGDSPAVRLDQDGSYGWTPQKWDICGNESNFFIRDATHASKLPFRIEPEAPTDSIFINSDGKIGLGTGSPSYALEVETTGSGAQMVANRTDGATMEFSASGNYGIAGTKTNHPVRLRVNDSLIMQLNGSGSYIEMTDGGYYDGTWHGSSSRELKENIENLTTGDAMKALEKLTPVRYNYKTNKEDEHVGFIAEDVPELVATKNHKALSPMDIVAVLTKVVQEQQKQSEKQDKLIRELKEEIDRLKKEK